MTVVFNKKILSLVMQGEGEKIIRIFTLSLLCNGYTTSKMQTPKIIRINIFLINSSRVLVIEVFDYSRQTNTLQFPSNSSFSLSVCKVFSLVIAYLTEDGKHFLHKVILTFLLGVFMFKTEYKCQ